MNYAYIKNRLDREIEEAKNNPEQIGTMWRLGGHNETYYSLFAIVSRDGEPDPECQSGCLTQIRGGLFRIATLLDTEEENKMLTAIIALDERIPQVSYDIRVEHLQLFYDYQLAFADYRYNHKDSDRLMERLKEI